MKNIHDKAHSHGFGMANGGHVHSEIHAGSCCCSTCGVEPKTTRFSAEDCARNDSRADSDDSDEDLPDCTSLPAGKGLADKKTGCSCCSGSVDLSGEEEEEEQNQFRREMRLLALMGAIFALTLIFERQIIDTAGAMSLYALLIVMYLICGTPVLKVALAAVRRFDLFNEFTLMSAATLAAIGIGEISEAVGVMLFYRVGEAFQEKAASQSRNSIKALLAQKPMFARIIREGNETNASPGDVRKGDVVKVLPGEMIPIDGVVKHGTALIDSSAMTGESVPVAASAGTSVHGGTLSLDGMLLVEASGPFEDSSIARILEMVQNAVGRKAPTERFIARFAKWYTPAVFAIASCVALIPPIAGYGSFSSWLYRGLVLLVISCPCALVISIPLGYFGGIGAASRHGILVKGAYVFDSLAKITSVIFDKTGTLTYGVFEVTDLLPANGVTGEELLKTAALAEAASNHPIARGVIRTAGNEIVQPPEAEVTQISGKGIVYRANETRIAAGSASLMNDFGVKVPDVLESGSVVHVMKNAKYLGYLVVSDRIRNEAADAVKELRNFGVRNVFMLTGDRAETAAGVSRELGLDGHRAELLPEDKVSALLELSGQDASQTLFVGDGANDGPVLVSAGIGVAMGGLGSQVAVEVADAVILDDSPAKAAQLFKIGKKTRRIVWQNVVFAMAVKGAFIVLGAAGLASLWEAVFADVGVALLAVLNATRSTRIV